jgi:hypothetical protein
MHISIRRVHPMRLHIYCRAAIDGGGICSLFLAHSLPFSAIIRLTPFRPVRVRLSLSLSLSFFGASARSPGEETGKRGPLGRRFGQCDANCVSVRVTR